VQGTCIQGCTFNSAVFAVEAKDQGGYFAAVAINWARATASDQSLLVSDVVGNESEAVYDIYDMWTGDLVASLSSSESYTYDLPGHDNVALKFVKQSQQTEFLQ